MNKDKLIEKLEQYIKLLGDELNDLVSIASVHGWKSNRIEEGKKLREEIQTLKNNNHVSTLPNL